jgi:hypothetical protein
MPVHSAVAARPSTSRMTSAITLVPTTEMLAKSTFSSKPSRFKHCSHTLGRNGVVGGVMTKDPSIIPLVGTASCGVKIDCVAPSTDGCTFASNGKNYIAHCEMDFYGNDFEVLWTEDFTGCVAYCASTDGCQAVSWSNGMCYLKNCISQGSYNPGVKGRSSISWLVLEEILTHSSCVCHAVGPVFNTSIQSKLGTFDTSNLLII